jgi:(p)ppGpp synthase/HD superfamily hydrolase
VASRKRQNPDLVSGLPKTRSALNYAERQHGGQLRVADGAPFIEHPIEVASLLHQAGAPDYVIAAGVLHDTLEKTPTTAFDLRRRFGSRVATLVLAVSEDDAIPRYTERKTALCDQVAAAGDDALMVFAADKVAKVRELRLVADSESRRRRQPGSRPTRRQLLAYYRRCLRMLEERLPDSPLVDQLRDELAPLLSARRAAAPAR